MRLDSLPFRAWRTEDEDEDEDEDYNADDDYWWL